MTRTLLHADATPAAADMLRRCVLGIWLIKVAVEPIQQLAALPSSIIVPIAPLDHLPSLWHDALMTHTGLIALRIVTCLLLIGPVLSARLARWLGPFACAAIIVHQAVLRQYAVVNHAELGLLAAACIIVASLWAQWLHERSDRALKASEAAGFNPASFSLVAVSLVVCLVYVFTGSHRMASSGIEVFTSNSVSYWAVKQAVRDTWYPFGLGAMLLDYPWLAVPLNVGFVVVTAFELAAPLCLISRRYRVAFLLVMVPFHVATLLTMNILFWENIVLLLLLFTVLPGDVLRVTGRRAAPAATV